MALLRIPIPLVSMAMAFASRAYSFSPSSPCNIRAIRRPTGLTAFIKGEAEGVETSDENVGGVGFAKRDAVKISGVSRAGKGSEAQELVRYGKLHDLEVAAAESIMEQAGCQLLCFGAGREVYQYEDAGSANVLDKMILLAPMDAAKNALASMTAAVGEDADSVVMNFLGGDELIIGEVLEACDVLVNALDLPAKAKVTFNSISFEEIPIDVCTVTVVASRGASNELEGTEESVARGEFYVRGGKWCTVAEGDIHTAQN